MLASRARPRRAAPAIFNDRMLGAAGVTVCRHVQSHQLELYELANESPARLPWHAHETAHFTFLVRGEMKWSTRGRDCHARPFQGSFHPAGVEHWVWLAARTRCFTVRLGNHWLDRLLEHAPAPQSPVVLDPTSRWAAMRLYAELRYLRPCTLLMIEGLTSELLGAAARAALEPQQRTPDWLEELRVRLRDELARPPRLTELAVELRMHPGALSRTFRHFAGQTYRGYMRELRVEQLMAQLASSRTPITELAAAVGYCDLSHCGREFKRVTGMTPADYRRSLADQKD